MADQRATAEIARLEALVAAAPDARAFAALAEAHRRAGSPEQAVRVAREGLGRRPGELAGRVALGLALLDLGQEAEARRELERVLEAAPDHPLVASALGRGGPARPESPPPTPPLCEVGEPEIEAAIERAEAEPENMVSVDTIAQRAMRAVDLGDASGEHGPGEAPGLPLTEVASEGEIPFATHTVANLLEQQGHGESARAMREEMNGGAADADRVVSRLERWLDNLRRNPR